jgi:alpha-aminoadipic semialdehyde synthase
LARNRPHAPVVELNITDTSKLSKLIKEHDVVVSFVPAMFHPAVAKLAIEAKKHMVTASYISPEMAALHDR